MCFDLQATVRVAFRLLAWPAALRTTHQYVPASPPAPPPAPPLRPPPPPPPPPPPRPCVTRRKKRAPSGKTSRWPRGSSASPSRYHVTSGGGMPSKAQRSVAGSLRNTVTFVGSSIIRGGTRTPPAPAPPRYPPPLLWPATSIHASQQGGEKRRKIRRNDEKCNSLCIQVIGELEFPLCLAPFQLPALYIGLHPPSCSSRPMVCSVPCSLLIRFN